MPRYSPRSAAFFVVAFCLSWQGLGRDSSTAQAGCGDYVHLGGMESTLPFESGVKTIPVAGRRLDLDLRGPLHEPDPRLPRRPCQGPHCRQLPSLPDLPPPIPTATGPQQPACVLTWTEMTTPVSQSLLPELDVRHDELAVLRIERPPRRSF